MLNRKKTNAIHIMLLFFLFCTHSLCALNNNDNDNSDKNNDDIQILLSGYLENDITLKELAIQVRQAEIGMQRSKIQNGISLDLSTGQFFISTNDSGSVFSVSPNAKISAPLLNNSSISLSADADNNEDGTNLENIKATFSTAIIGNGVKKARLAKIKAARVLQEAERALHKRSKEAEKDFYTALGSVYESAVSVLTLEDDAYTKDIELQSVKIQGYDSMSVRYRTVQLEAQSKRREALMQRREMDRKVLEFFKDCGAPEAQTLPVVFDDVSGLDDLADFSSLQQNNFTDIESAKWNHYIGKLTRKADKTFELSALGGITLNNRNFNKTTSANAGLALSSAGVNVTTAIEIPLESAKKPGFTFSVGLNLNNLRLSFLDKKDKLLTEESELLAIAKAEKKWSDTAFTMDTTRTTLLWEKQERAEEADLYKKLAADTTEYFKNGIVNESDYKNALSNAQRAQYQCLLTDIKIVKHLIDYSLYFTEE
ncbi:MAG: hypothetical protein Ta2F_00580 [Termitinemataceae bacterium]|nr:MAG: hypothetical protein Ta2F_00580 [Termitinemataceae bacterium]